MAALGEEILLSTVITISCRHSASSTFKFPAYRETVNPPTRTPHSTCHQHSANIDAGYTIERVDGQENHPNNYQTPPTSTNLPLNSTHSQNHKPNIPNQRKTTSYQATQPINSIATDRGFQCNKQRNKIFPSTYLDHTLRHPLHNPK